MQTQEPTRSSLPSHSHREVRSLSNHLVQELTENKLSMCLKCQSRVLKAFRIHAMTAATVGGLRLCFFRGIQDKAVNIQSSHRKPLFTLLLFCSPRFECTGSKVHLNQIEFFQNSFPSSSQLRLKDFLSQKQCLSLKTSGRTFHPQTFVGTF